MKRFRLLPLFTCLVLALVLTIALAGCGLGKAEPKADPRAEAPPAAEVVPAGNSSVVTVDKPEQFPLVTADKYDAAPELNVTGTVTADVSRNVPVISIASGRVVEILARLGDTVTKGQLLLKVQSADISGAFSDYRQAVADETLARAQLARSKTPPRRRSHGAEGLRSCCRYGPKKPRLPSRPRVEHLRVLGADKDHPLRHHRHHRPRFRSDHRSTGNASRGHAGVWRHRIRSPFPIFSHVWVLCDVFENDLREREARGIRGCPVLNAYPDRVFRAKNQQHRPLFSIPPFVPRGLSRSGK